MLHSASVELLSNASATGNWHQWGGGRAMLSVVGTFDGESVTLQMLGPDASTEITVPDVAGAAATLSANGTALVDLPPCQVRAAVSTGGGSPSGLYARLDRIPG